MQRLYRLASAAVPATSDRNFLWILEPMTDQAYDRARSGLDPRWRAGLVSEDDRRELFTFRNAAATVETIIRDLACAHIAPEEVELVANPG